LPFPVAVDSIVDQTAGVVGTTLHASQVLGPQRITVGPVWFNVKSDQFGAAGDNTTDDTAAIQAAINAAASVTFGKAGVYFPPGVYLISSALTVATPGMTLQGAGGRTSGGIAACQINYSPATGSRVIDARNTIGLQIRDIFFFATSSSYAGVVLDLSGASTFATARDCQFVLGGTTAGSVGLSLDQAIDCSFTNCTFIRGAIQTQLGSVGVCTGCTFSKCRWSINVASMIAMQGTADGLSLYSPTVEMSSLNISSTLINLQATSRGVLIAQPTIVDSGSSSTGTSIAFAGNGLKIEGAYMDAHSTMVHVSIANSSTGIDIDASNYFAGGTTAVALGTGTSGVRLGPFTTTATNAFTGTPGSGSETLIGGNLRLYEAFQRSSQTPTEAVLVSGVNATAGEHVEVTLTAARLVGAPLNPATGQHLYFTLIQNATGGFAVTWNAVFKVSWSDTGNTSAKRSTVGFWFDGTNWCQLASQTAYV
jgi:hypothetical protein